MRAGPTGLPSRVVEVRSVGTQPDVFPLFPLNTVLFPGMWLSLHVFEDRYKMMLRDCQEKGLLFGLLLIREGEEVGPTPEPYLVGTLARIHQISLLPNGNYLLNVQGTRRIRVLRLIEEKPYLQGTVKYLPDTRATSGEDVALLAEEVANLFREYLQLVQRLGGRTGELGASDLEPRALSWVVASALMIAPPFRQELLEMDDAGSRLQREKELLTALLRALNKHISRSMLSRPYPFSLN